MSNITHLIIIDNPRTKIAEAESRYIVTAKDYLANRLPAEIADKQKLRVVNLCNDYRYLKTGYYCSLLADARGHRSVPSTYDIVHHNWRRIYKTSLAELEVVLNETIAPEEPLPEVIYFFFGRTDIAALTKFGRKLFDVFRLPMMKLALHQKKQKWKIKQVDPVKLADIGDHVALFEDALNKYTGTFWNKKKQENDKYWLAVLHNPSEANPPSNKKALQKLIQVGKRKRFYVELITRQNLDSLLEYDALFIRETTNVNHHTYRFAQKAESEGIPCIDDTNSILRCCNKIYLHELLRSKKIRTPKTYFINRAEKNTIIGEKLDFPVVLKVPDGSFSLGVFKVHNQQEFEQTRDKIFKDSELLLVQEYLPSDYDWRIGILAGAPLFACKYYMAKNHWQIYNHQSKKYKDGNHESVPLDAVPHSVLKTALKAASLIGDGFYGVDIKEIDGTPYVIEVNDNPSLDAGVEDEILGDKIYEALLDHFQYLIDR